MHPQAVPAHATDLKFLAWTTLRSKKLFKNTYLEIVTVGLQAGETPAYQIC